MLVFGMRFGIKAFRSSDDLKLVLTKILQRNISVFVVPRMIDAGKGSRDGVF